MSTKNKLQFRRPDNRPLDDMVAQSSRFIEAIFADSWQKIINFSALAKIYDIIYDLTSAISRRCTFI